MEYTMTYAQQVRRFWRRGLMTNLEMQLALGLVTQEEAFDEHRRSDKPWSMLVWKPHPTRLAQLTAVPDNPKK